MLDKIKQRNRVRYLSFKRKHLGQYIDADGYWGFQCVDLIRKYCWDAFNYNMGKIASAKDANIITTFPGLKQLKIGVDDLWSGDIITIQPTDKNKNGHIMVVDRVLVTGFYGLEQNGSGQKTGKVYPGNEIRTRFIKRGTLLNAFRFDK